MGRRTPDDLMPALWRRRGKNPMTFATRAGVKEGEEVVLTGMVEPPYACPTGYVLLKGTKVNTVYLRDGAWRRGIFTYDVIEVTVTALEHPTDPRNPRIVGRNAPAAVAS